MVPTSQLDLMMKEGAKEPVDPRTEIAKGPFSQFREHQWI